ILALSCRRSSCLLWLSSEKKMSSRLLRLRSFSLNTSPVRLYSGFPEPGTSPTLKSRRCSTPHWGHFSITTRSGLRSCPTKEGTAMKIDFHAHAFPKEFFLKLKDYYPDEVVLREDAQGRLLAVWAGTPLPVWDHGLRIEEMMKAGVEVEILSTPSMYIRVDEHSPALCRLVNDTFAESCRQSPERFKAFANIPFNSMEAALSELRRALALPCLVGVLI